MDPFVFASAVMAASETDLRERDGKALGSAEGTIEVNARPREIKTIVLRLRPRR